MLKFVLLFWKKEKIKISSYNLKAFENFFFSKKKLFVKRLLLHLSNKVSKNCLGAASKNSVKNSRINTCEHG